MINSTARRRIVAYTLCTAWSGAGTVTANTPDASGLAQHQITLHCSVKPTAGVVQVSIKPPGAGYFVPVAKVDLTINGSAQIVFPALFDAVALSFSTALSAGTVSARLSSIGNSFTSSETGVFDTVSRRRFITTTIASWSPTSPKSVNTPNNEGLSQHQITLAGGAGTVQILGRHAGDTTYISMGHVTDSMSAAGSQAIVSGIFDAFEFVPVGTVSGTVIGQIDSIGSGMFYGDTIFRSTGVQPGQVIVNGDNGAVWLGDLVLGALPPSSFGWYGAFSNSTYLTINKPTEQDDASTVFTVAGAARWEVGATTELLGHTNDYHIKRVSGAAGSEVFTDVIVIDWTTGMALFNDGLTIGSVGGSFSQGSIYYSAALGIVHGAKSGSSYDWVLTDVSGNSVLSLETGTKKLTAWDVFTANNGLIITGTGSFTQGAIYKDPSLGLVIAPIAGTSDDLLLSDTAGNAVMTLPHGTSTLAFAHMPSFGAQQFMSAYTGSGSPNSVVTAGVGSIYINLSGGAGTTFWVKESGTGNTGWVGK